MGHLLIYAFYLSINPVWACLYKHEREICLRIEKNPAFLFKFYSIT